MRIELPYKPRPHQAELHRITRRFNVFVLARRSGKTVLAIAWLLEQVLACKLERPQGAFVAPFASQARAVAWPYLRQHARHIPGTKILEGPMRVDLPGGGMVACFSGDNPDALRGLYLDAIVLDECAQIRPRLWAEVIRPALADREGSAMFLGTPKGRHNLLYELYEHAGKEIDTYGAASTWARALLTSEDCGDICRRYDHAPPVSADELEAQRRMMAAATFRQEFECDFNAPILGAYYAEQTGRFDHRGQIASVQHDPSLPVMTSWDLGINDAMVVVFWQALGNEIRCFDCWEFHGTGLADVVGKVLATGYQYSHHIAPHDIKARQLMDAKSRLELARGLGLEFDVADNKSVMAGIELVRTMLPRCVFDRERCSDLLEALRYYHPVADELHQTFKDKPEHDWSSDFCDAVRMFAVHFMDDWEQTSVRLRQAGQRGGYSRERELRRRRGHGAMI